MRAQTHAAQRGHAASPAEPEALGSRHHAHPRAPSGRLPTTGLLTGLVVSVLVTSATVGSLLIGSTPAAAHGRSANGCTGVPDSGYGFDFHAACDGHDRCYRGQPYGSASYGRRQCDRVFLGGMRGYCRRHRVLSARRLSCRSAAQVYYYGVRALGSPYWANRMPTPIGW